jgi:hypothetical protein
MASECISLIFEQKSIRIVQPAGEWWVLADVCQAIEIVNAPQAASRLDDDEKGICNIDTLGGTQELLVVSEPGIYRPEAMIPLAKECHERIERDAAARTRFGLKAFPMFQEWLKRLPASQLRLPFDK